MRWSTRGSCHPLKLRQRTSEREGGSTGGREYGREGDAWRGREGGGSGHEFQRSLFVFYIVTGLVRVNATRNAQHAARSTQHAMRTQHANNITLSLPSTLSQLQPGLTWSCATASRFTAPLWSWLEVACLKFGALSYFGACSISVAITTPPTYDKTYQDVPSQ